MLDFLISGEMLTANIGHLDNFMGAFYGDRCARLCLVDSGMGLLSRYLVRGIIGHHSSLLLHAIHCPPVSESRFQQHDPHCLCAPRAQFAVPAPQRIVGAVLTRRLLLRRRRHTPRIIDQFTIGKRGLVTFFNTK